MTEQQRPNLATVSNTSKTFAAAGLTEPAIRAHIHGEHTNGLAEAGAVIRRGRRVLIDLDRYAFWLAGR